MANDLKRTGLATLELVLALPVILALIVAMVWLGFSLVGQASVTVEARHAAWEQRFGEWDGQAFDFNADNMHEADASQSVEVTPVLNSESGPEASHSVEQGNWDHRLVEFKATPNLELSAEMMFAAKTVGLVGEFEDLRDAVGNLQSIGRDALSTAIQEIASELTNPQERMESASESGKQRVELDRDLEKSKAEGKLRELRAVLERTEIELEAVDDESQEQEQDQEQDASADRRWLLEKRVERLEIEIELAQARLDEF